MSSSYNFEELLDLMPDTEGLGDNRTRLLYLCDMLRAITEPGNGLTIDEICELLEAKGQEVDPAYKAPARNTINSDLKALSAHPHLGTCVHSPARGKNEGFWFENLSLDRTQICLLINIVQACRFIDQRQCNKLVAALKQMVPLSAKDDIASSVYVDSRVKAASVDVFGALATAARALNENKKISYRYTSYGLDGKKHFIKECEDGAYLCETPISIVFSNDNYYLETWSDRSDETGEPWRCRLDRMEDVTVSDELAEFNHAIKQAKERSRVAERTLMSVDMLGTGEPCHLFLRVNELTAANIILNKFGYDCILSEPRVPREEGDQADTGASGVAFITVQLSATFYRLLCGLGDMVQIIKPKYIWSDQSKWTKRKAQNIPHDQLMREYERAVEGYTAHLRQSLSMYDDQGH